MILSTDSTANLPKEYYEKLDIKMIPMQIILEDETYDDLSDKLPVSEYYQKMREGATPTTAQINEYSARAYFENLLTLGEDILHICFSSAMSGTCAAVKRVADELNETHSNKIMVVDSLNASCGEGILVLKAHALRQKGKSIEEIKTEIENLIPKTCAYFTVEQLKYLVRGGRLSKLSGTIGTILNIKPVLRVDENGKLVSYKKIISRKKSIAEIANIVNHDPYMVLADFADYRAAQKKIDEVWKDREKWNRMAANNIAGAGFFAADRSIKEYADNIWNLKPVKK